MAAALGLGPSAFGRRGSSPLFRTRHQWRTAGGPPLIVPGVPLEVWASHSPNSRFQNHDDGSPTTMRARLSGTRLVANIGPWSTLRCRPSVRSGSLPFSPVSDRPSSPCRGRRLGHPEADLTDLDRAAGPFVLRPPMRSRDDQIGPESSDGWRRCRRAWHQDQVIGRGQRCEAQSRRCRVAGRVRTATSSRPTRQRNAPPIRHESHCR